MAAVCSKCGTVLISGVTIRDDVYCRTCSKSIPTCDKCKYHYKSEIHPKYGCCAYFNQYLQDYDNVCDAYGQGPQVHPDVWV
ncbi:MAG: hypothetical protein J1E35_00915 [Lachnospiraceae bacterium]|nr:hypothetical protein [Lachnospiraceae bacterium]